LVLSNDFSSIQVIGIDSIDKPRASRAQSQARLSYAETPPRLQASWVQIYNISTKQPNKSKKNDVKECVSNTQHPPQHLVGRFFRFLALRVAVVAVKNKGVKSQREILYYILYNITYFQCVLTLKNELQQLQRCNANSRSACLFLNKVYSF